MFTCSQRIIPSLSLVRSSDRVVHANFDSIRELTRVIISREIKKHKNADDEAETSAIELNQSSIGKFIYSTRSSYLKLVSSLN